MLRWIGIGCGGLVGLVVVLVILAVIVSALGGCGGTTNQPGNGGSTQGSSGGDSSQQAQGGGQKQSGETTVGVGQTATVGDASWVVSSARSTKQITDQFGALPPKQGDYVVVNFTFTNNGTDSKTLSPNIIALYDGQNRKSSPDTDTFGYIPQDKNILLNQVNPGVSKDGEVIFSVAPAGSGYKLELSDTNLFSSNPKAYVDLGF
jgi:uncharacterized protein DUF4352